MSQEYQSFPNGLGASDGDPLVLYEPMFVAGSVWYVSSVNGVNAAGDRGKDRNEPLASFEGANGALAKAVDGDMVVFLRDHDETFSGAATNIGTDLVLVGEGKNAGYPTVRFRNDRSNVSMWNLVTPNLTLRNVWIEENVQSSNVARINCGGQEGAGKCYRFLDVYMECGTNDLETGIDINGDYCEVRGSTFIATGENLSNQPHSALHLASISVQVIDGCVFDNGLYGFSNIYCVHNTGFPYLMMEGCSLLRGADVEFAVDVVGYANAQTATGSARINWCTGGGGPS